MSRESPSQVSRPPEPNTSVPLVENRRRLLRQIIDASPDIVYVFEVENGRNVFISRRFREVLGLSREHLRALRGAVLAELVHPDDAARVAAHVNSLHWLPDRTVAEIEYRMRTAEGSWRWLCSREVVFARTSGGLVHSVLGVATDVTERREAQERIRELDRKLRAAQDEERRRIAADLHDSTAQLLLGASLLAGRLTQLIRGGEAEDYVHDLRDIIEQVLKEIRISAFLLHPPALESEGLISVLRLYVAGFAQRTGIEAKTSCEGSEALIPFELRTALLRITQEALANVHRHAFARRVEVCVRIETAKVFLRIRDDGRGMHPDVVNTGMGVVGIRTRIEGLGGTMHVSSDRSGTTLEVSAPMAIQPQQTISAQSIFHGVPD